MGLHVTDSSPGIARVTGFRTWDCTDTCSTG